MILIVSGSTRDDGQTQKALALVNTLIRQRGIETEMVSVRKLALPAYGVTDDESVEATQWRHAVRRASGLVIGSPEYHGTFSGALKNLLGYLDTNLVSGKPAALVAAAGSPRSGIGTLNSLRIVLRSLHMPVIVEQVAVCRSDVDADTGKWAADMKSRISSMVDSLISEIERRSYDQARLQTRSDERQCYPLTAVRACGPAIPARKIAIDGYYIDGVNPDKPVQPNSLMQGIRQPEASTADTSPVRTTKPSPQIGQSATAP